MSKYPLTEEMIVTFRKDWDASGMVSAIADRALLAHRAIELLKLSDELYSSYGLKAESVKCGHWICAVRELLKEVA